MKLKLVAVLVSLALGARFAKRSLQKNSYTPTGTADTTNLVDTTYSGLIQGANTTQVINIIEVAVTGQAGSAAPTVMQFARDSTVGVTVSLGGSTDAPLNPDALPTNPAPVVGDTATTKPQRSATLKLLNLAVNAFGGIFRWVAAPGEEIQTVGNVANRGEVSLSAFNAGTPGLIGTHIIYEPF